MFEKIRYFKGASMNEPFGLKFFGGLGTLLLVYVPLRLLERAPTILFILAFCLISYGLGWLLYYKNKKEEI